MTRLSRPFLPPGRSAGPRISRRHQVQLFLHMQMMLASGVLIADALAQLKDAYPDPRLRRLLREVHAQVAGARTTLSRAFGNFPRSFPHGVVASVQSGEEGGSLLLADRFGDLAERIAHEDSVRRQIRRACAYPLFVSLMAIALFALLLGVAFPRLEDLLRFLGGGLPPLTLAVIKVSEATRRAGPAFAAAAAAGVAAAALSRRNPAAALGQDRLFLSLPLVGPVYRLLAAALVCKTFGSLHRASQPAPQIMDLCAPLVENRALRAGLLDAKRLLTAEGSTLAAAFARSGLLPPLACLSIAVGERSGRIAQAMDQIARHLSEEAGRRLDSAIGVAGPLLTLSVVGGVGLMLAAFFEALYGIAYVAR